MPKQELKMWKCDACELEETGLGRPSNKPKDWDCHSWYSVGQELVGLTLCPDCKYELEQWLTG